MKLKRKTASRCFVPAAFLFGFSIAQAQTTLIIPQIVDGGAWLTAIALTNTSASQTFASLSFFQETGGGNTSPWNLNFAEMTSAQAQALILPGGSTVFLHTLGTAPATTIGWAQLSETDASVPVLAYAIFTQRVPGRSDQDGTASAAAAVSRILVPFNNTSGVTSMAIANPTSSNLSISVGIRTSVSTTQPSPITLPPQGHTSFAFPTQFPVTAGTSGLAEFYSSSGSFSILALTFNGGAFTTAPVYSVTGPPIIASTSTGGGGSGSIIEGSFNMIKINTTSASLGPGTGTVIDQIAGDFASYSPSEFQAAYPSATFGPCSVLDATYPILGTAPSVPDSRLDAGTIAISGQNFPQGATLPNTSPIGGPFYDYISPTGSTLAYGGTYTLSSNGGTQVGPFSVSATIPNSFSVTNWDQITSINRAADLPVSWAGMGFDTVIIGAAGSTQTSTTRHSVSVTCVVSASLGTFSIPQGALAMLPAITASTGASAGQLVVTAFPGTPGTTLGMSQALTPSLVGGGKVNYGNFGAGLSVVKSVSIQ